jgi:type II secretory pathway pseudopilin PulG
MTRRIQETASRPHQAAGVRSPGGFTLLEALVVMAIIILLAAFGFPALQLLMARSKLQGSAREISVHLGSSRVASMRLGRNVVVEPEFDDSRLVAFVDDNENFSWDTDEKVLSSLPLPGSGGNLGVYLMGPDGVAATEDDVAQAIEGLTVIAGSPDRHLVVFEPDGSVRDGGGIRLSDGKSPANVFEVRVDPPATARVEILKFVHDDERGLQHDGEPPGSWFGQGGNVWVWY